MVKKMLDITKLQKLKLKDETIADTLERIIQAYCYSYSPLHGKGITPFHKDFKQSLRYECGKRGFPTPRCEQARGKFRSEKGYQRWLKSLEKIPKHLKGEI